MNHFDSFTVKRPIAFPCLITKIILKQQPNIVHAKEMKNKNHLPLALDKKLFVGTHVPDIMVKYHDQIVGGSSSHVSKATKKKDVLLEQGEVAKSRQETISASTIRKKKVGEMIKIMNKNELTDEETTQYEEKGKNN